MAASIKIAGEWVRFTDEVELRATATHIQWRYVGEAAWVDLVSLGDLQGQDGADGAPGAPGADGAPGAPGVDGAQGEPGLPATASPPKFHDTFTRADGRLGVQWIDAHDVLPTQYEPLGIYDEAVVVVDPTARGGTYAADQHVGAPPPGEQLKSIGCAWRETGSTEVSVKVTWSGNWEYDGSVPTGHHVEATPLLYVTPDHPKFGFGAWPSSFELGGSKAPCWIVGYIGNPPEDFADYVVDTEIFTHVDGTPREIELRTVAPGQVIVLLDGVQVELATAGLAPVTVDPELAGSTLHGFAVDGHFVWPDTDVPTTKAIEDITIETLGAGDALPRSGGVLASPFVLSTEGATNEWRMTTVSGVAVFGLFANSTDLQPQLAFGTVFGTPFLFAGPGGSTAPTPTMSLTNVGISSRLVPRVTSTASGATPAINVDSTDVRILSALAVNVTSMTTNLTGTPTNGQRLVVVIKDNGTSRTLTWGASFVANGAALPTATPAGQTLRAEFEYDTTLAKWGCVATNRIPIVLGIALSDETTDLTTGVAKATMRAPFAFTLTGVRASLALASSSGLPTVDVNEGATSVLSTKLTIDVGETTSVTAATPAVISDAAIADDALLSFDIDTAGTGAKGLKVWLIGNRPA